MKTIKTINPDDVLKVGEITVKKVEAYKTVWEVQFTGLGTKKGKVYFQEYRNPVPTYTPKFNINGKSICFDKLSLGVTRNNVQNFILNDGTNGLNIACELIVDNMDWITKSLCNKTKTREYNKLYGGYSKGAYELTINVLED